MPRQISTLKLLFCKKKESKARSTLGREKVPAQLRYTIEWLSAIMNHTSPFHLSTSGIATRSRGFRFRAFDENTSRKIFFASFFSSLLEILKIGACHVGQTKNEKVSSSCTLLCVTYHVKTVNEENSETSSMSSWQLQLLPPKRGTTPK